MAFTQGTIPFKLEPHKVYNIDYSVGQGRHNRRDDVMLVQKLLRLIYYETDYAAARGFPPLADVPDIAVDGSCGPVTRRYIVYFKKCLMSLGHTVYPDAVVLPFGPNPDAGSAVTKTAFTMRHLLETARRADDAAPLHQLELLPSSPDVPELLRVNLQQVKSRAPGYRSGT